MHTIFVFTYLPVFTLAQRILATANSFSGMYQLLLVVIRRKIQSILKSSRPDQEGIFFLRILTVAHLTCV